MDIQGFTALADANVKDMEAQAEVALKLSQANLIGQQANHQALENLALYLKIQWDAQAHHHLLRMRGIALQKLRGVQTEAKQMRMAVLHTKALFAGSPSWAATRDGWLGWAYLWARADVGAIAGVIEHVPAAGVYAPEAWAKAGDAGIAFADMQGLQDLGAVLDLARRQSYYPRLGGPAWVYLAGLMEALAQAAAKNAAEIDARVAEAQTAAEKIYQQDWDRLKPQPEGQK